MSLKGNKRLVIRYYTEVVGARDYSNLFSFIATGYIDHNAAGDDHGPELVRKHLEAIRTTFPDFTMHIEGIFAEGDYVITRVTGSGTHLGEWMSIKPSGREILLKGINIDRVESGKIVEHCGEADTIGMLMQMGVDPFMIRSKG
jgi:predicted ester cyclase